LPTARCRRRRRSRSPSASPSPSIVNPACQWHVEQAAGAGATMREVLEAVEVGMEMGGGPATASARFALEVMEGVFGELQP